MRLSAITALIFVLSFPGATAGEGRGAEEFARETELEALEYRNERADSVFGDVAELSRKADPEGKGVNIIYDGPKGEDAPRITLSLRRISLYDAIRCITEMAGLRFRIDESAVVIRAKESSRKKIVTRFYPVTPSFRDAIATSREEQKEEAPDRLW